MLVFIGLLINIFTLAHYGVSHRALIPRNSESGGQEILIWLMRNVMPQCFVFPVPLPFIKIRTGNKLTCLKRRDNLLNQE